MISLNFPEQVNSAIKLLENSGFEAYAVGGCVRDRLMGREPNDYDITTNALPSQTAEVFKEYRCLDIGIKHGTLTVLFDGFPLEITTYRLDGKYLDNRHPESVSFSAELSDDLARRDFTVNTLCYSESKGLVDLFGGAEDIRNKVIRCVGDPDRRFSEDALRILRAIRFSCTLGFTVEEKTAESVLRNCELIDNIAIERVRDEFTKLICASSVTEVCEKFLPVIGRFIPEFVELYGCEQNTPYHIYDVFGHTLRALEAIESTPEMRLAMFFHDIGKPECRKTDEFGTDHFKGHAAVSAEKARNILKRMKYPNAVADFVCALIENHSLPCPKTKQQAKKFLSLYGEKLYEGFIKVRRADCAAKADPHSHDEKLENMKLFLKSIRENGECYSLKQLKVNGNDLMAVGVKNGPDLRRVLELLLNEVIFDRCPNEKNVLLKRAEEFYKE